MRAPDMASPIGTTVRLGSLRRYAGTTPVSVRADEAWRSGDGRRGWALEQVMSQRSRVARRCRCWGRQGQFLVADCRTIEEIALTVGLATFAPE
jgi:hypothetical protein